MSVRKGLLTALLAVIVCSTAHAENIVIVLSWDGVRHDYPDRGKYPALQRMEKEGVRGRLTPTYPSSTFPTHVSMATGTHPDKHGIVGNVFYDRDRQELHLYANDGDWMNAEPVWITAQRQGIDAATYFWVGSYSDWRGQGHRYREKPFDPSVSEKTKVDKIFSWLDLPVDERPRLIMAYWQGTDTVGHRHGPDSPKVAEQLATQDVELARLIAGIDNRELWEVTTLILVSDHGMADASIRIDVEKVLTEANIKATVMQGAVSHIYLDNGAEIDKALSAIADIEHINVFTQANVPASYRLGPKSRTGDLIITTVPPYGVGEPSPDASPAGHGFHPDLDDMKAVFFAMGNRVKQNPDTTEYDQVDLAKTITHLLDIEAPLDSEGKVMEWVLDQ